MKLRAKKQDRMEKLLNYEPLPCRKINKNIIMYLDAYGDDLFLETYQDKYKFILMTR